MLRRAWLNALSSSIFEDRNCKTYGWFKLDDDADENDDDKEVKTSGDDILMNFKSALSTQCLSYAKSIL